MSTIALLALSIASLVSIWSGRYEYVVAVAGIWAAAIVTDLVGLLGVSVQKHYAIRNTEVVFSGMAEGAVPQELRDQIRSTSRQAWEQAQRDRQAKGDSN